MRTASVALALLVLAPAAHAQTYTFGSEIAHGQANSAGQYASLVLDNLGQPHAYCWGFDGPDRPLYVRKIGASWLADTVETAGSGLGQYGSLAFDPSGNPQMAYGGDFVGLDGLRWAKKTGGTWTIELVDATANFQPFASIADSAGTPHIAYIGGGGEILHASRYGPGNWQIEVVDPVANAFQGVSLKVDATGVLHIAYHDNLNEDLKYARRPLATWVVETVEADQNTGRHCSLAIDALGNPHVSYVKTGVTDTLRYAVKSGGSWTFENVSGPEPDGTSLALDPLGRPRIAYYDWQNGTARDLGFAWKNSVSWLTTPVDQAGDVGAHPSLALDLAGNPRIAYFDADSLDLKLATGALVEAPVISYLEQTTGRANTVVVLDVHGNYLDTVTAANLWSEVGPESTAATVIAPIDSTHVQLTFLLDVPVASYALEVQNAAGAATDTSALIVYDDPVDLFRSTLTGSNRGPDFPPAGAPYDSMAFFSSRLLPVDVYVKAPTALDLSPITRVTFGATNPSAPSWSPEAARLVYADAGQMFIAGAPPGIIGPPTPLLLGPNDRAPSWSPVSEAIAFSRDTGAGHAIFRVNSDGTGLTQLTFPPPGTDDNSADWSPDGAAIVFTRGTLTTSDSILVVSATAGEAAGRKNIAPGGGLLPPAAYVTPAWSPDGRWIAYTSDFGGNFDIYVADSRGVAYGNVQITNDPAPDAEPAWYPDGTAMAFASTRVPFVNADIFFATNLPTGQDADGDLVIDALDACPAAAPGVGEQDRDWDGCADAWSHLRTVRTWGPDNLPAAYRTNAAGDPRINDGSEFPAVAAAFDTWAQLPVSALDPDPVDLGGGPANPVAGDGVNSVVFLDAGSYPFPFGILALTPTTSAVAETVINGKWYAPGEIVDADIVFNMTFSFSTPSFPGLPGAFDLQSVATHEAGHFHGISHSCIASATMFYAIPQGIGARTPESDDALALKRVYPHPGSPPDIRAEGTVVRPTDAPIPGAAVLALSAATGDTLEMTLSAADGDYVLTESAEDFRVYVLPLDGSAEVSGMLPGHFSQTVAGLAETDFLAEYMDIPDTESDFGSPGQLVTMPTGVAGANIKVNRDVTGPAVLSTSPPDGAGTIHPLTAITVKFSEKIDLASVSGASFQLEVAPAGPGVGGAAALVQKDSLLVFTPGGPLAYNTTYNLTVGPGILDKSGNPMAAAAVSNFITSVPPPLTISNVSPIEVPVGGTLVIQGTGFDPVLANNVVAFDSGIFGPQVRLPFAGSLDRLFVTVPNGLGLTDVHVDIAPVTSNTVVIDIVPPKAPPTGNFIDRVALGADPRELAVSADGALAFVATDLGLTVVDALPTSGSFLAASSIGIPGGATGVMAYPSGNVLTVGPSQPRLRAFQQIAGTAYAAIGQRDLVDEPLGIQRLPGSSDFLIAYPERVVRHAGGGGVFGTELQEWSEPGLTFLGDLAVSPDGGEAYASTGDGKIAVLGLLASDVGPLPGDAIVALLEGGTSPREMASSPLTANLLAGDGIGTIRRAGDRGPVLETIPGTGGYSGLAFSPEGSFVYAANFILNRVDLLDLRSGSAASAGSFATGVDPRDVATGSAGRYAYVITGASDELEVYDTESGPRITSVSPQAGGPGTLVTIAGAGLSGGVVQVAVGNALTTPATVDPAGTRITFQQPAAAVDGPISVTVDGLASNAHPYDVVNRSFPGAFDLVGGFETGGASPSGIFLSPSGRLLVARKSTGEVAVLRADPSKPDVHTTIQTLTAAQAGLGGAGTGAFAPDGRKFYAENGSFIEVFSVDEDLASPLAHTGTIETAGGVPATLDPVELEVTPDGTRLFALSRTLNSLFEISTARDSLVATIAPFLSPEDFAVHPGGLRAYVGDDSAGGSIRIVDIDPASGGYRTVVASVLSNFVSGGGPYAQVLARPDGNRIFTIFTRTVGIPAVTHTLEILDTDPLSANYHQWVGSLTLAVGMPTAPLARVNHTGAVLYDAVLGGHLEAWDAGDPPTGPVFATPVSPEIASRTDNLVISNDDARAYVYGVSDTVLVYDLTPVGALAVRSGDGQTGVVGEPLPAPVVLDAEAATLAQSEGCPVYVEAGGNGEFGSGALSRVLVAGTDGTVRVDFTPAVTGAIAVNATSGGATTSFLVQTVGDTTLAPPQIVSVAPTALQTPGVNTAIAVDFSKSIRPSTVSTATFFLQEAPAGPVLPGVFTFAESQRRVVFQPDAPLDASTIHRFTLTAGLEDYDGNPLANPGFFPFETAPPAPLRLNALDAPAARVGDRIVLSGTGFSAVPSENRVLFGALEAPPLEADPGAIVVAVPGGATTGDVRVEVGFSSSNSLPFTVLDPAPPLNEVVNEVDVPTSGQQIAIVPDGSRAYMTSPGAGTVVPILIQAAQSETPIQVGLHPFGVATSPSGDRVYASNFFSNDVSVIDAVPSHGTFHKVIATIRAGKNPSGIASHPDGRTLFVVNYGDSTLMAIDTDSTSAGYNAARQSVDLASTSQSVVVTPDGGRVIVGTSTGILILKASDLADVGARSSVDVSSTSQSVVVTPDGAFAVVLTTNGKLFLIDIQPGSPTENTARSSVDVSSTSQSVVVSPDGASIYVTLSDGTVQVFQIVVLAGGGASAEPGNAAGMEIQLVLVDTVPVGENPQGMAFDPSGSGLLLVVNAGSKTVSFLSTSSTDPLLVRAALDMDPNTLNLKSKGQYVIAYLEFPEVLDPADVDLSTVRLEGTVEADTEGDAVLDHDEDGILERKVRFLRSEVAAVLPAGQQVPVTVTGMIGPLPFTATDSIKVIGPTIQSPGAQSLVQAGVPTTIHWTASQDGPGDHVDIFWTHDDGASWDTLVAGTPDDSYHTWNVPEVQSTACLVMVVVRNPHGEITGIGNMAETFTITSTLDVEDRTPKRFFLHAATPNPSRSASTFLLDLPEARRVSLRVFGVDGALVRVVTDASLPAGRHALAWDGRNEAGTPVAGGVYFARLVAGTWRAEQKIIRTR